MVSFALTSTLKFWPVSTRNGQDCVDQFNASRDLPFSLTVFYVDPEVLAALPEDMRREVIEQEIREKANARATRSSQGPIHAEEMDNASHIASLRTEEILLTAADVFNSLRQALSLKPRFFGKGVGAQHRRQY
jgi:hypothetical protein